MPQQAAHDRYGPSSKNRHHGCCPAEWMFCAVHMMNVHVTRMLRLYNSSRCHSRRCTIDRYQVWSVRSSIIISCHHARNLRKIIPGTTKYEYHKDHTRYTKYEYHRRNSTSILVYAAVHRTLSISRERHNQYLVPGRQFFFFFFFFFSFCYLLFFLFYFCFFFS